MRGTRLRARRRRFTVAVVVGALLGAAVTLPVAASHSNSSEHLDQARAALADARRALAEAEAALDELEQDLAPADAPDSSSSTSTPTTAAPTTAAPTTAAPTTTASTTTTAAPVVSPQPGNESRGSFRVECDLSHRAQVDPIVAPGRTSAHMHDFFGNTSTSADSTYDSMRRADTTCTLSGDTAGYWAPSLVAPDGSFVEPEVAIFYYRNRPVEYSSTVPFPGDMRIIAGGADAFPNAYWTCDGESDTGFASRRDHIPDCGSGGKIKMHIFFPSCWDGVNLDSPDHRSHVAYGLDDDDFSVDGTDPDLCPASHPIKIPQLDFRVKYPVADGRGYRFADGEVLPHADFWNTWVLSELQEWVEKCLWAGESCKLARD